MIYYKNDRNIQYLRVREPIMMTHPAADDELLVHDWRVERLTRICVPGALAEG